MSTLHMQHITMVSIAITRGEAEMVAIEELHRTHLPCRYIYTILRGTVAHYVTVHVGREVKSAAVMFILRFILITSLIHTMLGYYRHKEV